MFLTQEKAAELTELCYVISTHNVGFKDCPNTVQVELYICAGEVLFAKATNLQDDNDFAYLETTEDLETWMGLRFPKSTLLN